MVEESALDCNRTGKCGRYLKGKCDGKHSISGTPEKPISSCDTYHSLDPFYQGKDPQDFMETHIRKEKEREAAGKLHIPKSDNGTKKEESESQEIALKNCAYEEICVKVGGCVGSYLPDGDGKPIELPEDCMWHSYDFMFHGKIPDKILQQHRARKTKLAQMDAEKPLKK